MLIAYMDHYHLLPYYLTITLSNKYDYENYSQNFYVVEIGSFKYTK